MTEAKKFSIVDKALAFATAAHDGQVRKGEAKMPYITHPVAVAQMLTEAGITSNTLIAAALLHDTIEDCDVTYDDLENRFGPEVASVVLELTTPKDIPKGHKRQYLVEKAAVMSNGARIVKIADRTCNLIDLVQTPPGWNDAKIRGYIDGSYDMVAAMKGLDAPVALVMRFMDAAVAATRSLP